MAYIAIANRVLGYSLTEKQAEYLATKYTVKGFNDKCFQVVMGSDLQYDRFIAWLDNMR